MAYSTKAGILKQISETVLIQLTDDKNIGIVDDIIINQAIADADAEIDSYCGNRHTVPFSAVPAIIEKMSVDIAIYNLYSRRKGAPEDRQKRYDNAIRFLRDVSKGAVSLGADAPPPTTTENTVSIAGNDRIFTRGKLGSF